MNLPCLVSVLFAFVGVSCASLPFLGPEGGPPKKAPVVTLIDVPGGESTVALTEVQAVLGTQRSDAQGLLGALVAGSHTWPASGSFRIGLDGQARLTWTGTLDSVPGPSASDGREIDVSELALSGEGGPVTLESFSLAPRVKVPHRLTTLTGNPTRVAVVVDVPKPPKLLFGAVPDSYVLEDLIGGDLAEFRFLDPGTGVSWAEYRDGQVRVHGATPDARRQIVSFVAFLEALRLSLPELEAQARAAYP